MDLFDNLVCLTLARDMAENPATGFKARRQSTCSGSYSERIMGGRKAIADGGLFVCRQKGIK
jgi:hypothetical protein